MENIKQKKTYQQAGDIGNVLMLICTFAVTACMLNKWPNEELFDNNWSTNGFCVVNQDSTWMNSHIICFYAGTVFSLIIAYVYVTDIAGNDIIPPVHQALIRGAIMGVFGHGLGHVTLSQDPTGMDLRIRADDIPSSILATVTNVGGFSCIFLGTMPLSSTKKILTVATIATLGFTLFDIPPKLNFVYGLAAISTSSAASMLTLSTEQKDAALYSLYPYFQMSILAFGFLESTSCEKMLAPLGGHVCFDAFIPVSQLVLHFVSKHMEKKSSRSKYDNGFAKKSI
mmetsp:Transcript_14609/g.20649  ORF Transcript_14609/g.20649 Transcript_14609/m.20649 type:complete len:284 (+) Transcript_14609:71-922(+)